MKAVATAPVPASAIRVNLTVPVTGIGFGAFSFDPLEQMMGAKLSDLLGPLLVGPVMRRPSANGPAVEAFALALPEGEGASIQLAQRGEVGLHNDGGLLALTAPWGMAGWLRQRLGDVLVRGPEAGVRLDGSARLAKAWVRLRPGMRASVQLGAYGEAGVEAG